MTPTDNAGQTLDNARDIGILTSTAQSFNDFVGDFNGLAYDPTDVYKFEITENSTVNLKVSGLSATVAIYLYDINNQNNPIQITYAYSQNGDTAIINNLKAGTYYIAVNIADFVGTNYQLEAQATSLGNYIDNAGNTVETAKDIGILGNLTQTFTDYIGNFNGGTYGIPSDDYDFYKFAITENSTVEFKLSSLSANASLWLYNSEGSLINYVYNSGNLDKIISENLLADTYYIRVTNGGNGTSYQLEAQATSLGTYVDNAGNTVETAKDVGILGNVTQIFEDYIGNFNGGTYGIPYDGYDFYKFEITENSTVNLKLSGLSANANLYLLNKDGIQITNSTAVENSDETITQNLIAGTYYIQVSDFSTTGTNYQLEAQATSLGTYVDNAGNTVETAKDIGILGNITQTFTDYIGNFNGGTYGIPYDADDFYKFEVTENSKVNLKLRGLTEDANLWLYDDKGNFVDAANTSGNSDEVITKNLITGTYYIQVADFSTSGTGTSYQLEADAIPSNYFDNAGNTVETAKDIGILGNVTQTFEDYIGNFNVGADGIPYDGFDFYKFAITENSTVNFKLTGLSTDANLRLYDDKGNFVDSANTSGNSDEFITKNLITGTYYIQVADFSTSGTGTSYQLEADAIPSNYFDNAGNTVETAKDIGILGNVTQTFTDYIGDFQGGTYGIPYDGSDFYKFAITENSTVNFKLSGLSTDANLSLYDDKGNFVDAANTSGNSDEVITKNLVTGTYYIQVADSSTSGTGTSYQLEANANPSNYFDNFDNAGNNVDTAKDIGILGNVTQTFEDYIGNFNGGTYGIPYDGFDFYKFAITENSTVNLKLSGLSANANLYLLNKDGIQIINSTALENSDETITQNLIAGTYYIQVADYSTSGTGTSYQLEAQATSLGAYVDTAGDTVETAKDIGILDTNTKIVDEYIGNFQGGTYGIPYDADDFYKFEITENSTVNFKLSGLSEDANLWLYDDKGNFVDAANTPGNSDEFITRNLIVGTYYLKVSSQTDNGTSYQLEAQASSLGAYFDNAGDNEETAKDIGVLDTNTKTIDEFIGNFNAGTYGIPADYLDVYKFEVKENSTVDFQVTGLTGNSASYLFISDINNIIAANYSNSISRNISPGIYYLAFQNYSDIGSSYKLEATATSLGSTPLDNAGNTVETARNIGVIEGSQQFTDFIGNYFNLAEDNADFYRFQLTENSNVEFSLSGLNTNGGALFTLGDGQINFIQNTQLISTSLSAGDYYLVVIPVNVGGTNYTLNATGTPVIDLAGNSIDKARDIGNLIGSQTFNDFVGSFDTDDFYRFELKQDSNFNLTFTPEKLGVNTSISLLNSQGNYLGFDSTAINATLEAGVYYAQVARFDGDTNYNVTFSAIANSNSPLQIQSVSPVKGSNLGQTTITVKGTQFTPNAQVSIIDANGTELLADTVNFQSDISLAATFNLVGANAGNYDVKVVDTAGTATAEDLFQVNTGNPGKLDVFISAPSAIRPWSIAEVVVTYRNSGDTDITAPLLTLSADGALWQESGEFNDSSIQFLGINKEGNAGVLPPGASGTFTAKFKFTDSNVVNANFKVNTLATGETVDWNGIKESSRPETIPVDAWDVIFNNFVSSIGNKPENYEAVLAENATRLSQLGEYTNDVSRLLGFELQQNNSQAIFERFNLGTFGRGFTNPWNITITTEQNGNVTIQNGGSLRFFTKKADGSYQGEAGDFATLTKQGDIYQLKEQGGDLLGFRQDGKLDFIQDTNNNKVTLGYTDHKLTDLTYSNGEKITFTYNNQGRVREVTDQFGQTTSYSYDVTGEKLLSITDASGTISYTYDTGIGKEYAIKTITYPDGTTTFFEYDNQGRLIKESSNGGAETLTYNYDSAGGVTVTDANGKSSQFLLNDLGQVSQIKDAIGRVSQFRYDDNGNLTRIITPGNNTSSFTYDNRGNLISSVDPKGQKIEFTYDSQFDQIATVRDQRGNDINYNYDSNGNLKNITYEDGSQETFTYNQKGEVIISANRRGEGINYTYNSRGQLTKKVFADGTEASFEYDNRGNLIQATDADSSVSYAYDNANRLTKVDYSTGRFLEFTYDAGGRRSKMVDQDGFTTNYKYDQVGRLQQLTDKNGANIITYTYDNIGRLAREDNGNGTYTTYSYDAASQLLNIVNYKADNTINSRFDYTYDELGRRTSVTTLEGKTSYGYDAIGQLISVTLPDNRVIEYTYDAAGNRISVQDNGANTAYKTNNLNQYTTVGNATYNYDTDGNLVSQTEGGKTTTFTYNTENRLIKVTSPDGTWNYEYDALGNRIATVYNGQRTEYLLDPTGLGDVVGEYSGAGIARYTHGLGLVSRVEGSNATYYDTDAIGSTVGLTGAGGNYLNRYSYLPFGEDLSKTETVANPFEFVGQWGVMDEGNGLDFMRARFYAPGDGRFISADPIGINGGLNLYAYVFNNPVDFVDETGLIGVTPVKEPMRPGYKPPYPGHTYKDTKKKGGKGGSGENGKTPTKPKEYEEAFGKPKKSTLNENPPTILTTPSDNPLEDPIVQGVIIVLLIGGVVVVVTNPQLIPALLAAGGIILRTAPAYASEQGGKNLGKTTKGKLPSGNKKAEGNTLNRNSYDPNDIIGPGGYGTENWLTPNQVLPYSIRFENLATATAPAVFITITHKLDSDLDLSTFELGDFGFGDIYIDVPEGFQSYTTRLDLRDTIGDFVDFNASLDPNTRTVTWKLTTIDPITGQIPDDVDAGFLPPNNANHDGEGFVNYRIKPKADVTNGTAIDAQASIVFDTNAAIETPVWSNKIDVGEPSSEVKSLAKTVAKTFTVTWDGSDNGSGIAGYDVYVSVDGGGFTLWKQDIQETSAIYTGEAGKKYSFYTVAKDNVGYTEIIPTVADTTTNVNNVPTVNKLIPDQNTDAGTAYNYVIPEDIFQDIDEDDQLTYTAILANGDILPNWLTFNSKTRTFSGTPTNSDVENLNIQVVATDSFGEQVNDILGLNIRSTTPQLTLHNNGIFTIAGGNGKPQLSVTLASRNSNLVNELGVFIVDDEQGNINGIAPGNTGYVQAALARAKVVFSIISNLPNGFNQNNLSSFLELNTGDKLGFLLVRNSTIDAVIAGKIPVSQVLFSRPSSQKIEFLGDGKYSLAWRDGNGNNSNEFQDLVVQIQAKNQTLPMGAGLQANTQSELIDLRSITGQVTAEFVLNREAAFDNVVGFYQIADPNGGIDIDGNGTIDSRPGDAGYTQAALQKRVTGLDMTVANQGTASFKTSLNGGAIFAPFIIANGNPEALLDNNSNNDPSVYFAFLGANSGGVDHIRLLGNNVWGFEDLPQGGDMDYNDVVMGVNFSSI